MLPVCRIALASILDRIRLVLLYCYVRKSWSPSRYHPRTKSESDLKYVSIPTPDYRGRSIDLGTSWYLIEMNGERRLILKVNESF